MSVTVDDPDMELFDGSDWRTYTNAPGGWYGGTYHETCDDRDDLTITFKGVGIRVYGGKRPNYGYYYAELDGSNRRFFNAHSTDDEIPALLFEASNLDDIDHSLWMMNQQNYGGQRTRSCFGIDYMVIQPGGSDAPAANASASDAHASDPAPSPVSSVDPAMQSPGEEASASPTASGSSSTPIGLSGHPINASVTPSGTGPNLSNFTQPPSADEVGAPDTTWTTGSMTAVTGQAGVYSGQPMPVYTGQSIGAGTPNLPAGASMTGAMAGSPNNAWANAYAPELSLWFLVFGALLLRLLRL